jgi:hypothetical protein
VAQALEECRPFNRRLHASPLPPNLPISRRL